MATRAPVDVFGYRDYRAFLRAYYAHRKSQKAGYTYAKFSENLGLGSPNYLKLVIDGQRNLGSEIRDSFGEECGLSGGALKFFCSLVAFNQAKTAHEREVHYTEMGTFKRFRATHRLDSAQADYYSQWYIPAVFELCGHEGFEDDPRWIASRLLPPITPKQASKALKVLDKLGLTVRDKRGRLVKTTEMVETAPGPLGHHVVQYHRAMMERASAAMDDVPREDREIASLTLSLSDERMQALKAEIVAFRTDLHRRYMKDERGQRVVQVNFQMFPMSKKAQK